jgi:pantetheine-phosphate adenylyltransferase
MTGDRPAAVYPGSFDPIHMGHMDIIERATQIFPKVIVGILENTGKDALFTTEERVAMVSQLFAGTPSVEVRHFRGLLVKFMADLGSRVVVRGMRAVSDFEYEFQMALMNRRLSPHIETVFLTPKEEYTYLSSRLVKEVAALGGEVEGLVPDVIRERLEARFETPAHPPTR